MGYIYTIEKKTLWEKEKLLVMSNFFFPHNVFKSCLLLICQNEDLWSKGLNYMESEDYMCNSLSNDRKLVLAKLTKLKTFADDKFNVA